jgi:hypothetical protein
MKLKLTDVYFDFAYDVVGKENNIEMLQGRLRERYIGEVFDVEDESELEEAIWDESGWFVNAVSYVEV